jgi:hypothetical protein
MSACVWEGVRGGLPSQFEADAALTVAAALAVTTLAPKVLKSTVRPRLPHTTGSPTVAPAAAAAGWGAGVEGVTRSLSRTEALCS